MWSYILALMLLLDSWFFWSIIIHFIIYLCLYGVVVQTLGTAFVDDSSLSITSRYCHNPTDTLQNNDIQDNITTIKSLMTMAQHWERLLFSMGGAINMQKSFWYLIAWVWKKGVPTLATSATAPGIMELTSGYSSMTSTVPRIEPSDSFHMLGVYISPSRS